MFRNFGTKLWNSFQVRVSLVLLDGEAVGTSRTSYKKRSFQKYCAKELKRFKNRRNVSLLSLILTLRLLMSYIYIYIYIYIYGAPILDVSRSHTTTQHSR